MKRLPSIPRGPGGPSSRTWAPKAQDVRRAYTLVEMLMSVALTLMMMLFVVQIFGLVGQSVDTSRAVLEMNDQLRSATDRLRKDLQGATADMNPPLSPEAGKGYFEIIEGPIGPVFSMTEDKNPAITDITDIALNVDEPDTTAAPYPSGYLPDSTVADNDDILMFTSRSRGEPFVGRVYARTPTYVFGEQQSAESPLAEICYFLRGTTLYRGVRLIKPEFDPDTTAASTIQEPLTYNYLYSGAASLLNANIPDPANRGFYNNFDLSVRFQGDPANQNTWVWVPNTLADLTKRENRFAHQPPRPSGRSLQESFPFHPHMRLTDNLGARYWNTVQYPTPWQQLRLPTLAECSHANWMAGWPLPNLDWGTNGLSYNRVSLSHDGTMPNTPVAWYQQSDSWNSPLPINEVDPDTGTLSAYMGPRVAEDVLLTNVISFDVKVWDPGARLYEYQGVCLAPGDPGYSVAVASGTLVGYGAYVDLGYGPVNGLLPGISQFSGAANPTASIAERYHFYDTWSTHYEKDGQQQIPLSSVLPFSSSLPIDSGTDGFDNDGDGIVDGLNEQEAPAPYARPLRGIQIKIRMFEPDSRRVREVTIVHDFLSE